MRDRARPRLRRKESTAGGFTLIELLITMTILGLAMALITSAVIKAQRFASDAQGSADANSELRMALADIDKQVRSGNVLYSPANEVAPSSCTASGTDAGTCMRVYTQANGLERCVQWQVVADAANAARSVLRSRSWSTAWQTDGNYTGWVVKARNLVSAPSAAPFSLQGASTSYSSRYLQVRFEAVDPRRTGTAVLTSALAGRNTNYGYDAGLCSPAPPTT